MVRYPLGGVLSSSLQWLVGFQRLGHDVYLVEKAGWENSCYDPVRNVSSNDCRYGVKVVRELLARFGLEDNWCFVDSSGNYHGLSEESVRELFRSADVFIDRGTHGAWLEQAAASRCRIYIDGEPAFRQMSMQSIVDNGGCNPEYDYYFTTGRNVGTSRSSAPTAGKSWLPLFHPVLVDLFPLSPPDARAPFSTVMNWQSHAPVLFNGFSYGHKDVEFERFMRLPRHTSIPLEVAVSGKKTPFETLRESGWRVRDAHEVTISFDSYLEYARLARGEFSICKHGYVATNCGWFSDRSAAYLASGRPVIMQDTGFGDHLPLGQGLLAFKTLEEAVHALATVSANLDRHSRAAREIALEYLDAPKVLKGLLTSIGIQ